MHLSDRTCSANSRENIGLLDTLDAEMDEEAEKFSLIAFQCVTRGAPNACVIADMPFMSYQASENKAILNAGRFIQEGGAQAVKIECHPSLIPLITRITAIGIPVIGHIGLTPQSVYQFGGYHKQGKSQQESMALIELAKDLQTAGCFAIVLECVPEQLAKDMSALLTIPTIGIGAGPHCDGQVLVTHDLMGLTPHPVPSFVKQYAQLRDSMKACIHQFKQEVETSVFPKST